MPRRTGRDGPSTAAASPPAPAWGLDAEHDPGPEGAAERAGRVELRAAEPVVAPGGGRIVVGTASWTDPTMTAPGVFYPRAVHSPEDRLRYYSTRFPVVEVDSTYYAIPARQIAELWVERTPDAFTFDVKAHALMTGQPSEPSRLPREIRDALPEALRKRSRVYAKDLPPEIDEEIWRRFLEALEPLHAAGKLGSILLQYPRWFVPSTAAKDAIVEAKSRLGAQRAAVELRNRRWFGDGARETERTLSFLRELDMPFVMVDVAQGFESSVPPLHAVTSSALALVRMHGRNAATWEAAGASTVERYRYLYDERQLTEWVGPLQDAAAEAREVHVLLNNCYANYGTTNALELDAMLRRAYGSPT